jgi:hypothetical protein
VPSDATASPSKECEIGRSSLTRRCPVKVLPPSWERDRRKSDANSVPSGLGFTEDQER